MKIFNLFMLTLALVLGANQVQAQCAASFQFTDNGNGVITFYGSVAGSNSNGGNYYWDLGEGSTGSGSVYTHTYVAGAYTVCLTYWDSTGCQATYCDSIFVSGNSNPCANYYAYFTSSNNGTAATYSFVGQGGTPGTNQMYTWDFGDGTSGQGINVSHTYTVSGTYTVCVIGTDPTTGCSDTFCSTITVQINTNPCANYSAYMQYSMNGNVVSFFGGAGNAGTSGSNYYSWDFGDGTSGTGANPTHTYANVGTYLVCITAYDTLNNCSDTYCDTITIASSNPCSNFYAYYQYSSNNGAVTFYASNNSGGTNNGIQYTWDFGNGNTGTGATTSHIYIQNNPMAYYNVCLTAYDPTTGCTDTYCSYVLVVNTTVVTNPGGPTTWNGGNGQVVFKEDENSGSTTSAFQELEMQAEMNAYPNPTANVLNVNITSNVEASANLRVLDLSGKTVLTQATTLQEGEIRVEIEVGSLPTGIYLLELNNKIMQQTIKFAKQ